MTLGLPGRCELPRPPVEIADEVEEYAREYGRHATLQFVPTLMLGARVLRGTWVAKFTLRPDDKRMKLHQMGVAKKPPTEDVWFHTDNPKAGEPIPSLPGHWESDNLPLDIVQMGPSGVRAFLEKGNTWSGRGQYASIEDQVRRVDEANEEARKKFRAEQKEASRHEQRDKRRWRFKIPVLPVGIDLKASQQEK